MRRAFHLVDERAKVYPTIQASEATAPLLKAAEHIVQHARVVAGCSPPRHSCDMWRSPRDLLREASPVSADSSHNTYGTLVETNQNRASSY